MKQFSNLIAVLSLMLLIVFCVCSLGKEKNSIKLGNKTNLGNSYRISINNLALPFNAHGVLADVKVGDNSVPGGFIDNNVFIYSGGFLLSGINDNDVTWINGVATASRVDDYLPGNFNGDEDSEGIFLIRKSDLPFGEEWQNWTSAVLAGANFYDGDNDGVYNPVDLNNNGLWDPTEDSPDILGDETVWCVYNDARMGSFRTWYNVDPQGIEIRQTIWAYKEVEELANVIFIRYSILNTGIVSDIHDSVYFSIWTDPDLGDYWDDLSGSDPLLNAGYTYNDGPDSLFGVNPPCFMTKYLQGPWAESELTTDFALNIRGSLLGVDTIWGNVNKSMSSFFHFSYDSLTFRNIDNEIFARNFMLGLDTVGQYIDPCIWLAGTVYNYDCSSIDPAFFYSGNPVTMSGWINNLPDDQRQLCNTGPFKLAKDKPVDIIIAYIVGRGTNALNSITEAKSISNKITTFYETNFYDIPVAVQYGAKTIPKEFNLSQNYPNPFNPSTTIKYEIPSVASDFSLSNVTLKVYDILGREVATLVNKQQKPGYYEVKWEASTQPSGVYFYTISAGSFVETKKMILLR